MYLIASPHVVCGPLHAWQVGHLLQPPEWGVGRPVWGLHAMGGQAGACVAGRQEEVSTKLGAHRAKTQCCAGSSLSWRWASNKCPKSGASLALEARGAQVGAIWFACVRAHSPLTTHKLVLTSKYKSFAAGRRWQGIRAKHVAKAAQTRCRNA